VAWSDRAHDLRRLEQSQGLLAGFDALLIDGFTRDVEERGRFVGATELRALVVDLVESHGGKARLGESPGSIEIIGTEKLAALLNVGGLADASRMGLAALKHACYYGEPLELLFDGERAGRTSGEFVGIRHPLVRAAVSRWKSGVATPHRYAVVGLPERIAVSPTLVIFHLVETTGLQSRKELTPTCVDLNSFSPRDDVGFALLQALAKGTLVGSTTTLLPETLTDALRQANVIAEQRRYDWERERAAANASLVDARAATQVAAIQIKIAQAEATLEQVRSKDERVVRLYQGRIRNLRAKQHQVEDNLSSRRLLAVTLKPVGMAVVVPV
jgi:hypothetical protein